jgi:hypothetical protein
MSYNINEIVITPVGRGVVTENLNDEVVSVKLDGNGEDRFRVDEVSYDLQVRYPSKLRLLVTLTMAFIK